MQQIDNERDEEKSNIRVVSLIGKAPKRHLGLYRFDSDRTRWAWLAPKFIQIIFRTSLYLLTFRLFPFLFFFLPSVKKGKTGKVQMFCLMCHLR